MNKNNYIRYQVKKIDIIKINYYMIHCIEHKDRLENINRAKLKLQKPIIMFDGINTKNVLLTNQHNFINNFNKDIKPNFFFKKNGQIGCYLSHFKIIENIMQNNLNTGYSVIFEDDVFFGNFLNTNINIIVSNLDDINLDFDIIFLGNCNNKKGVHLINNIYYLDDKINYWGTHALLINNKNIKKIYDLNCNILNEIDTHYVSLIKNKKLNGFIIHPSLCYQNSELISTIKKN
jgi:GR25 family glycosyltransferase involved in LPS biosynthesis